MIVTDDLRAVLSDVGLSRVITNMGVRSGLTTGGQGVEFVAYQAKELYEDNSKPTTMSDVYAFGGVILTVGGIPFPEPNYATCLLILRDRQTMSGKGPFWQRKTNAAVFLAIYSDAIPSPRDHVELPSDDSLWKIMNACWESRPKQRPDMTEVWATLPLV